MIRRSRRTGPDIVVIPIDGEADEMLELGPPVAPTAGAWRRTGPWVAAGVGVVLLVALSHGRSGPSTAVGDTVSTARPVVLTLGTHEPRQRDVGEFVAAVGRLSRGSIEIRVRGELYRDAPDPDGDLVTSARSGVLDLAQVSAARWDGYGVHTFRPLVAPFAITGYSQQTQLSTGPLAARALAGVKPLGLVGIALIPGELRHLVGITQPVLSPADIAGRRVAASHTAVAADTMTALGAAPADRELSGPLAASEIDLNELSVDGYARLTVAATTNVTLWPRVQTVVMNAAAYARLTPAQRDILHTGGREAAPLASVRIQADEARAVAALCRIGYPLVQATPAGLDRFQIAVSPVLDRLARNPNEVAELAAIAAIRSNPASAPTCQSQGSLRGNLEGDSDLGRDGTIKITQR